MSLMFEDDRLAAAKPKRDQRLPALLAIALMVASCSFLSSVVAENTRPVQSLAFLFGPAPAAQSIQ
jgi:hypothetical protein